MTVIADILANSKSISPNPPYVGIGRSVYDHLHQFVLAGKDFAYPTGFTSQNEVTSIAQHATATGGTYALTMTLFNGQTFTTAAIAYNAIPATVQTAINVAATAASITGWANDSIVCGGAALSSGAMTFTFSGTPVAGQKPTTTIDASLVTYNAAVGTAGAVSTTTVGDGTHNAVQTMAKYLTTVAGGALHVTGGTFTLHFALAGSATPAFTTAAIAYNAAAATIQTAINTAATAASVVGWSNNSIVVAGGDLTTANLTFTFSGTPVTNQAQPLITVSSASLTSTVVGVPGVISSSTNGQSNRPHLAALAAWGIVTDVPPVQGQSPTTVTSANALGQWPIGVTKAVVEALAREAAILDNNLNIYTVLAKALKLGSIAHR